MNVSRDEEQRVEWQIADLRLSSLESLAREISAQSQQMDRRLSDVEERMRLLQLLQEPARHDRLADGSRSNRLLSNERVPLTPKVCASQLFPPRRADVSVARMCDYCLVLSDEIFPCPQCGREWYCSDVCQRLRLRCHASRCRACCSLQCNAVTAL